MPSLPEVMITLQWITLGVKAERYPKFLAQYGDLLVRQSCEGIGRDRIVIEGYYKPHNENTFVHKSTASQDNNLIVPLTFYLLPLPLLQKGVEHMALGFEAMGQIKFLYVHSGALNDDEVLAHLKARKPSEEMAQAFLSHSAKLSEVIMGEFSMQQKRLSSQERVSQKLRQTLFRISPQCPPPNEVGQWTPKIIADYYDIEDRAVRRAIAEKYPKLTHGKGVPITLDEQQMQGVVQRLADKPIIGKKISQRKDS